MGKRAKLLKALDREARQLATATRDASQLAAQTRPLGFVTNWDRQVAVVATGSHAERMSDETPAEFQRRQAARFAAVMADVQPGENRDARRKRANAAMNRLRPLKATGVTTWERNRQRQHEREANRDDHRAVQPRPKASPYKGISKPNASRGLAPVLTDIDRAAPLVRARLKAAHEATFGAYQA